MCFAQIWLQPLEPYPLPSHCNYNTCFCFLWSSFMSMQCCPTSCCSALVPSRPTSPEGRASLCSWGRVVVVWWCGGGVVVWWVRVNQCKVVLGDMEVLLWWSFHDSKISSEIEEAPRQNLLTLLKQFWSKNDKMPKYNMAILLYELLSKMLWLLEHLRCQ